MSHARFATVAIIALVAPAGLLGQTQVITDPDSVVTISVPADWIETDMGSADASVQMLNPTDDTGLLIITESKTDFFGWNMDRLVYVVAGQLAAALDFPEFQEIQYGELEGFTTARIVASGAAGGQQFTYWKMAIDGPEHFVQLIMYCSRSVWDERLPVFEEIYATMDLLRH